MTTSSDPDTTQRVEQTEYGFRLHVRSKRGTGTRDEDKVSVEANVETLAELEAVREDVTNACTEELNRLRENQPDAEDEGEE